MYCGIGKDELTEIHEARLHGRWWHGHTEVGGRTESGTEVESNAGAIAEEITPSDFPAFSPSVEVTPTPPSF